MTQSIHVALASHPANPAHFHQRIDATLSRRADGALRIDYAIRGLNLGLRVPTPRAPAPADALWRTTCCELFIGGDGLSDYREFNFSPSSQWSSCDFVRYRERAAAQPILPAPTLTLQRSAEALRLEVVLPATALPAAGTLCLGISVVLEGDDGSLGYWALAHAPGKPDFHDRRCFILMLAPQGFRRTPEFS